MSTGPRFPGPSARLVARRALVAVLVVVSLAGGAAAIQAAATWTAEFARFPSPVPGIAQLTAQLAQEEDRSAALQAQLDDLLSNSADLASALDEVDAQVGMDTGTAADVRASLEEARARVAKLQEALRKAGAILPAPTPAPTPPSAGAGAPPPAATPTPAPTSASATARPAGTLSVSLASGQPLLEWTACTASNFAAFAIVRSQDSEIHFPAETNDMLVALVANQSASSLVDSGAPAGTRSYYRVWCSYLSDNEYKTIWVSNTVAIVP